MPRYKIIIENLNVWYGKKHVLKNINLKIEEKKITCIMGPSGCGKSTLLRTINRLNDLIKEFKMSGNVLIEGIGNIYSDDIDVYELRRRVAYIYQKPNPFPMSIFDNVAFGLRIHGIKDKKFIREKVREALEKVGLWDEVKDRLEVSALKLSGGQQQRLCIARALALDPEVLLMDEPTAFLDPIATEKIEKLIVELSKEKTIVLVSHEIHQALRVSDYIAFLYLGELVEYTKTKEILRDPTEILKYFL